MIEHKSEENNETEDKNLTEYELIWKKMRDEFNANAKQFVPQMYEALIKEGYTPQEAREKIKKDSINIWKKETIDKFIPVEAKQEIKVLAGKKGSEVKEQKKILLDSESSNETNQTHANNEMIPLTNNEIQQIAKNNYISKSDLSRQSTEEQEQEQQTQEEKEYNVTIFFAGKDIQLKVIATHLKKIIPPNKYVSVVIN